MLHSANTKVRGRFSHRCARNASAALENFLRHPQKTFSTVSTLTEAAVSRVDERACYQVVLDAESSKGHHELTTGVRAPDTLCITPRAVLADLRHAAIIEHFSSQIDKP